MDSYLKELLTKLDSNHKELSDRLQSVDKTLVRQEEQLAYHIKRTDLLEEHVKLKTKELKGELQGVKEDTAPIHTHVDRVKFLFTTIKWIGLPLIIASIGLIIKAYLS